MRLQLYRATYTAQLYRVCISRMRYTVTDADGRTATGLQVFSTLGTQPIRHATARARGPKAQNRPDKTPGNSHVLSSAVLHGLPVLFLIRASCVGSSIGDAQIEEVRNPANLALMASMAKLSQRIQHHHRRHCIVQTTFSLACPSRRSLDDPHRWWTLAPHDVAREASRSRKRWVKSMGSAQGDGCG